MNSGNDLAVIEKKIYAKILNSNRKRKRRIRKIHVQRKEKIIAFSICFVILLVVFGCIYYYNLFINLKYNVQANLAQVDTQLQKRKNLVINLGTTVVDYSKHEREVFTYLGELRTAFSNKNSEQALLALVDPNNIEIPNPAQFSGDLADLEKTLSQLMAIAEQYPELKLSENFQKYMDAILEFENDIAQLRMNYNDSVNRYSTTKDKFPGHIFASILGFEDFPYFRLDIDEQNFIEVKY